MKWFRLWTEIIDDPKLSQLSDSEHRRFIHCLAVAAEQEKEGRIDCTFEELAWRIRTKPTALKTTIDKLILLNILKQNGKGLEFIHWKKRQFRSDNITERVQRYRRNVSETLHETPPETETEQRQIQSIKPLEHFEVFWKAYPKKKNRQKAVDAWKKIKEPATTLNAILIALEWQKNSDQWMKQNGQFIPYPSTYLNARAWEDEPDGNNEIRKRHRDLFCGPDDEEDGSGGEGVT